MSHTPRAHLSTNRKLKLPIHIRVADVVVRGGEGGRVPILSFLKLAGMVGFRTL